MTPWETVVDDNKLMQLATVNAAGVPWICSVWHVRDRESGVIYFMSRRTRRHSSDIAETGKAAATFVADYNAGLGEKGMAVQMTGDATLVTHKEELENAYHLYSATYPKLLEMQRLALFISGEGAHYFYRFVPREIVYFNECDGADNPRMTVLKGN